MMAAAAAGGQLFRQPQLSSGPEETMALAEELARGLAGDRLHIITLEGDLGAGKTRFVKGMARGLEVPDWYYLNSPTFTLINEYRGRMPLYHFDLYRLGDTDELFDLGFSDYLAETGVLAIEWPAKAFPLLPASEVVRVRIELLAGERRRITLENFKPRFYGC